MCWCGGRHRTETQLGRRGEGFKRKIRKDVQNAGETQSVKKSTLREERSYVCVCVCDLANYSTRGGDNRKEKSTSH